MILKIIQLKLLMIAFAIISFSSNVFSQKYLGLQIELLELTEENSTALTPNQLLVALLSSSVDMIWNGGIGTFIKSSSQSHE